MKLNDKYYDVLKWVVLLFLPSFTTMVQTIGTLLEWDGTQICVGILVAVTTFLGGIISVSTVNYNKNNHNVTISEEETNQW